MPLRQPLLALKRSDPSHLIYLRYNSHWNPAGAILLPRRRSSGWGDPSRSARGTCTAMADLAVGNVIAVLGGRPPLTPL